MNDKKRLILGAGIKKISKFTIMLAVFAVVISNAILIAKANEEESSEENYKAIIIGADGESKTNYDSVEYAIAAMESGCTLLVNQDYEGDILIPENEIWSIGFGEYTYTGEIQMCEYNKLNIISGIYNNMIIVKDFGEDQVTISEGVYCNKVDVTVFSRYLKYNQCCVKEDDDLYRVSDNESLIYQVNDGTKYASACVAAYNCNDGDIINVLADTNEDFIFDDFSYIDKKIYVDAHDHYIYGTFYFSYNVEVISGRLYGTLSIFLQHKPIFHEGVIIYCEYFSYIVDLLREGSKLQNVGEYEYKISYDIKESDYKVKLGNKKYLYFEQAVKDSKPGDTIEFIGDYIYDISVDSESNVKVAGSNYKLSGWFDNYGVCEILSGIFDSDERERTVEIATSNKLTISGGTFLDVEFFIYDFGEPVYDLKGGVYSEHSFVDEENDLHEDVNPDCIALKEDDKYIIYGKNPAKIELAKTSYIYNGIDKKPGVKVYDTNGRVISNKYYDIKMTNTKNVGEATVTVTMKDGFEGTKSVKFTINPATMAALTTSSNSKGIIITWKKNSQATGYIIYKSANGGKFVKLKVISSNTTLKYLDTGVKNGMKYQYKVQAYTKVGGKNYYSEFSPVITTYRLNTPVISSVAAGKKIFTVKWNKNDSASGYEVQYCSKSNFSGAKTAAITSKGTVTKKVAGMQTGKKYYVRVRTYKTVSGKKYYSGWSAVKTVTVK